MVMRSDPSEIRLRRISRKPAAPLPALSAAGTAAKRVTDVEIWETGRCYIITNHSIKERSCYYGNH